MPGQYSSGGKTRLGRITQAGEPYLRNLLVLGARSVLALTMRKDKPKQDPLGCTALLRKKFDRQDTEHQAHDIALDGEPQAILGEPPGYCCGRQGDQ